jgi:hypothetical protein
MWAPLHKPTILGITFMETPYIYNYIYIHAHIYIYPSETIEFTYENQLNLANYGPPTLMDRS